MLSQVKNGQMNAAAGEADEQSILALLTGLVDLPSRAAQDDPAIALDRVRSWLLDRDLPCRELFDARGRMVGLTGISGDGSERPTYFLNAPIDTAGYGDPEGWGISPGTTSIRDGRLYGRGSGDSKAGVAIFCHLFDHFHHDREDRPCALGYVFDAEEHSGRFTGMRRFLDTCPAPITGVMIGYPGIDRIISGARGFWRATIVLHGLLAHSGSSSGRGVNAIEKADTLLRQLAAVARLLPGSAPGDRFPLPPKLTVTGIRGGGEFSLVPDRCEVDVDIRLTPGFEAADADVLVRSAVAAADDISPGGAPAEVAVHETYPAYLLPQRSTLLEALRTAASDVFGEQLPSGPCGPSNVGNLLATRGIDALCGFGVRAGGLHGFDEWIEIETIGPVFSVYRKALAMLLRTPVGERRWQATTSAGKSFA
jgi:succinyl-diaminopimelate desuccinylase